MLGFVNKNIYNSNMVRYSHKHIYVYGYELSKRAPYYGWQTCEYRLCTDTEGHNNKQNRALLETMLRIVCGHMPKGVKFLYEKAQ